MKLKVQAFSRLYITTGRVNLQTSTMRIRLKMVRVVALTKKRKMSLSLNQKNRRRRASASLHQTIKTGVRIPRLQEPQHQSRVSLIRSLPSLAPPKPNRRQLQSPHKQMARFRASSDIAKTVFSPSRKRKRDSSTMPLALLKTMSQSLNSQKRRTRQLSSTRPRS